MDTLEAQAIHLEDLREWEDALRRVLEEVCNWRTLPDWRDSDQIPIYPRQ